MSIWDQTRPYTFVQGIILPGGSSTTLMPDELFGVITGIKGLMFTTVSGDYVLSINDVPVFGGFSGGGSEFFPIDSFAPPWIPVNPSDVIRVSFDSIDGAATLGVSITGLIYAVLG